MATLYDYIFKLGKYVLKFCDGCLDKIKNPLQARLNFIL